MTYFHFKTQQSGHSVEHLLKEQWQGGKKIVHLMRMAKSVLDSTHTPIDDWRAPLAEGTEIIVTFPDAISNYHPDGQAELKVLYEDQHILAVAKPAGIAVHPDGPDESGTLMNRVMAYIQKSGGKYAEHIHRLDKGTSGVVLIAKHPIAKSMFDRMIEQNNIARKYVAEVDGYVKRPRGSIKFPIGRDRHHPARRLVSMSGQPAITHFRVIERRDDTTMVEAQLETGRTHQIRVHLSHIGHPVKGDTLYGGSETDDGNYHLTATTLSFIHPFTDQEMMIELKTI